jgi:NTE family protein
MPHAAPRRALTRFVALPLLAFALAACDTARVPPERLPRFERLASPPRVALVLGSGGPRGFAHVGVLKALEDNGVRPDVIVGASVGAMVGALYASGRNARDLERIAYEIDLTKIFRAAFLSGGMSGGATVQEYINELVAGKPLEALKMPLVVVVTRERDRRLTLFDRGDTGLAVRASAADPDQFKAVRIGDERYLDGDEVSPVPIKVARDLGAQVVIAVDVSAYAEDTPPGVPEQWIAKDQRRARQIKAEAPLADVLLHPNIGYYAGHNEQYRHRVIGIAEAYTRQHMPEILAAVRRNSNQKPVTTRNPAADASR